MTIDAQGNDTDIIFKGTDGSADTTFLTIDGSAAGAATFNDKITAVGTSVFTNLDISGDIDVDGTTNLDIVDIDGAVNIAAATTMLGTLTVGVDDTGHDVKLFGATSGVYSLWDESADSLILSHGATLNIGGDTAAGFGPLQVGYVTDNNSYVQILSDVAGNIHFGDSASGDARSIGALQYRHDTDTMRIKAGGNHVLDCTASTVVVNEDSDDVDFRVETGANTHTLFIDGGTDKVMSNETVADFNIDAGGLCLNQAGGDNALISFKSSDVAHGTTGSAETDTYALFKKNAAAAGGLMIHCFSENDTTIKFRGYATNDNTTQSGSGSANFVFDSRKKNGTSAGAHGANANLFCIQNDGNTRFIVDEDGDILHDGAISAYDSYDDAHLVRAMDLKRADPATIINSKWDKFVQYNYDDLKKTGILGHLSAKEEAEGQKPFIKMGALQRLHNGAIWQQYEKHNQLLDAVYELAKEAVGEEKANAILDKHEVKRLN
jgi:hypothetical protein